MQRQVLGWLGSFHEGLEQAGKHRLGDANQLGMVLLKLGQNHPPGLLHGGKDPHVQRLKFICRVGWQADKGNVVCLAQVDDGGRDVAGKVITYDELFAWPLPQPGQEELHKPLLKQKHIKPAALAALVDGALRAALPPGSVHIQRL